MTTAFTSTSRRVCQSYLQTGARTPRATPHVAEEDSVASTAWNAESSTVEKREVVPEAKDTTTCLTKRSAKGVAIPRSLEANLAAEVRLGEMMLETAGLKEVRGTDMSRRDIETMIATTAGAEVLSDVEVATGTNAEDSAGIIYRYSLERLMTADHCGVRADAIVPPQCQQVKILIPSLRRFLCSE